MKKVLVTGCGVFLLLGCNKDKFQTSPQIQIKSISTTVVPVSGTLNITLSYTDKEGDISDTLFLKKERLNQTVVPTVRDSIKSKIPDFPSYDNGEIRLALDYENYLKSAQKAPPIVGSNPSKPQPDTLNIKIWIHDKAGHVSDTVSTGRIVILRND